MPDRLSVLDASFFTLETPSTPLQAGGIGIFEPGLRFSHVHEALAARVHAVPLARQRLLPGPFGSRPAVVDDTEFDLSFHLRHAALPSPGDAGQLGELLTRLISRPLDRKRPLWELYVIEGLEGGRVAVFRKVHLAWASEGGTDVFSILLDDDPDMPPDDPPPQWTPARPPTDLQLAMDTVRERAGQAVDVGTAVRQLAGAPGRLMGAAAAVAGTAANVVARVVRSAPDSPLNVGLTPHRRFAMVQVELEALRGVRRVFGGTINDVVVAVVADAVGRLLRWRGYETKDLDLQVMLPVRVEPAYGRTAGDEDPVTLGEGVVGVLAPLPVMQMDAVARLYRVMGELAGLRESRQAVAANDLVKLAGYAPPNLHAAAARLVSAEQRYNVALSNAPGPQEPRYLRGRRLLESYPFIPLAGNAALSVAVSSYAGGMHFGLLGDRDALADLEVLAGFVQEAVEELRVAAERQSGQTG